MHACSSEGSALKCIHYIMEEQGLPRSPVNYQGYFPCCALLLNGIAHSIWIMYTGISKPSTMSSVYNTHLVQCGTCHRASWLLLVGHSTQDQELV